MLEGEAPVECVRRLDEMGVLPQIDAALTLSPERLGLLARLQAARAELAETLPDTLGRAWPAYLAALVQGLDSALIQRVCARLALSFRLTDELVRGIAVIEDAGGRLGGVDDLRPSEVVAGLRALPDDLIPLLLAWYPERDQQQAIWHYLRTWRHIRPCLTGDDVKRLGGQQGPEIGRLLARLQAAKLDGQAPTREAEEALIRTALSTES
jgi:tRNA nucleotidyltransferase (CCA-adding enzyme)